MTIPILAIVIRLLWILFEYPYLRRHRIKPAKDWDRHSAKLWDAANLIEPIGMFLGFTSIGRIQTATNIIGSFGLTLLGSESSSERRPSGLWANISRAPC